MQKIGHVSIVVIAVILAYLVMGAAWPAFMSIISTANSSANYTSFQSTQHALNAAPIWLWFIPAFVGGFWIVMILRSDGDRRYG